MRCLKELQKDFAQAILENNSTAIIEDIKSVGIAPLQRLATYRNNVTLSLLDVLNDKFPIVRAIVSDGFFNYIAHEYIKLYPSESGNLDNYGEHFATFLSNQASLKSLAYISDIARYEWYDHLAHHAGNHVINNANILTKLDQPEAFLASCHIMLHPSLYLLSSSYPIDQIIAIATENTLTDYAITLEDRGVNLFFIRPENKVYIESISTPLYYFVLSLKQRSNLESAYESATYYDPSFDAGEGIAFLLKYNAMTDVA